MNAQLPTTFVEAAALEFAREEIEWFRANKLQLLGIDVGYFDDADARHFGREMVKRYALSHTRCMMNVVDYAKAGWDVADDALRELILEFHDRREELPTYLGAYAMDIVARGSAPRHISGPKKANHFFRDIAIAVIVAKMAKQFKQFGLKPTRNAVSSRPSICSIFATAAALPMGEPGVNAIWRRLGTDALATQFLQ